jgi:hypothetical protein
VPHGHGAGVAGGTPSAAEGNRRPAGRGKQWTDRRRGEEGRPPVTGRRGPTGCGEGGPPGTAAREDLQAAAARELSSRQWQRWRASSQVGGGARALRSAASGAIEGADRQPLGSGAGGLQAGGGRQDGRASRAGGQTGRVAVSDLFVGLGVFFSGSSAPASI